MSVAPSLAGDTIFQGAAHICINQTGLQSAWKYIFAEGDVTISLKRPEADMNVAGFGAVANRLTDELVEVTFTPASHLTSDILTYLYSTILAAMPGSSYFGATSTPIAVHTMSGRIFVITNCKPTTFPAINFGIAPKRFDGAITLTGVLGRGMARTDANALFTPWAALSFTASPNEGDFNAGPCAVTWAQIAGVTIESMTAWKLTPKIKLTPRLLHNLGTIDYTVEDVVLEASCEPANLTESNLWASYVIGATRSLGSSVGGGDLTLTEDNPGLVAVIKNARLVEYPTRFDTTKPIAGACTWRSRRNNTGGTWNPAGTLAMAT